MSGEDSSQIKCYIQSIEKSILPRQNLVHNKANYVVTHMHLAQLYYSLKNHKKAFYHISECHGSLLRHYSILEEIRREGCFGISVASSSLEWDYISPSGNYAKLEDEGLFKRISEMPYEWTIVHISRIPGDKDYMVSGDGSLKLNEMFISRVQGGSNPDEILIAYNDLSNTDLDILNVLNKAAEALAVKAVRIGYISKCREKASSKIQNLLATLDDDLFMDWKCLLLGKLQDSKLENLIRSEIDKVLARFNVELPGNIKQLFYLIAEGVNFFKPILVRSSIEKNMPNNKNLKKTLFGVITNLMELYPQLSTAKRHPVILIVDDHLDIVPWENMAVLKDQAVTRIPSIHFLHALYKAHESHINNGLREIPADKINYYIVNPDGNLPKTEARLKPFFEARLPNWQGLMGEKPSPQQMIEALSNSNTYMYCGHGSGAHLINNSKVQQLNLTNSVQLVFGCKSGALTFSGGVVPMMGDILHYCIAGSACSLGMIFVVMSDDVDKMTMHLTNLWLPGTPINLESLTPLADENMKEPELLRVLPKVRQVSHLFSNAAALISRGLPVKIVPAK